LAIGMMFLVRMDCRSALAHTIPFNCLTDFNDDRPLQWVDKFYCSTSSNGTELWNSCREYAQFWELLVL